MRWWPTSQQSGHLTLQLSAGRGNLCEFPSFVPIDLNERCRVDVSSVFDPDKLNLVERDGTAEFVKEQPYCCFGHDSAQYLRDQFVNMEDSVPPKARVYETLQCGISLNVLIDPSA